ncbi:hypothetical protein AGMMS49965_17320 [Bacteroidia bacterium]|nr:hypothetical protein AGMMS49965_17320 [Bacteroidia bacterium]
MKQIFFLFCTMLGLSACESDTNSTPSPDYALAPIVTLKSYIETFVDCKQISIHSVTGVKVDETKKVFGSCSDRWVVGETNNKVFSVADGIELDILGHILDWESIDTCIFYDNSYFDVPTLNDDDRAYYLERKRGYDYYTALIGDTAYNARLRGDATPLARAIITPLKSIVIVADKDFSSNYLAGSDLSSLFTVYFDDPYSTVKNGYKSVGGTYRFIDHDVFPQSVFKTKLSEANFEERPFINAEWLCFLDVAPEKTDTYSFLIKATFVNGTVLEATAPPINIKGTNE